MRMDAIDEYRWRRDPDLVRFDAASPTTETFASFLAAFEYELSVGLPGREAFALETPDGEHIGTIMYYNADGESAELGISVAVSSAQGHGLGSRAVAAFLRYLWETHPFRRVVLHTLEWNERARRCFTNAGFEPTSRVVRRGEAFVRFEARREYWLLRDLQGDFAFEDHPVV